MGRKKKVLAYADKSGAVCCLMQRYGKDIVEAGPDLNVLPPFYRTSQLIAKMQCTSKTFAVLLIQLLMETRDVDERLNLARDSHRALDDLLHRHIHELLDLVRNLHRHVHVLVDDLRDVDRPLHRLDL